MPEKQDIFPKHLYGPHLQDVLGRYREAMEQEGVDVLVIDSGGPEMTHYDDDHGPASPVAPNFARLAPTITKPNNHTIVIEADGNNKPVLLYHSPNGNFWQKPTRPSDDLNDHFDIRIVQSQKVLNQEVANLSLGERMVRIGAGLGSTSNDSSQRMKLRMEWERRFKTNYEIECMIEASRSAAMGHLAARDVFLNGGSELEMHAAFLRATGATDDQLAFPSIVSLDADTAWLHRPEKDPDHRNGGRALIDAGTRFNNYNSDITTTWVKESANVHEVYVELLRGLETIQKDLCAEIRPGVEFVELHEKAHYKIAELLLKVGILQNCTPEEAVKKRFTTVFLPHGLGHLLGIQTHDKGGKQARPEGGILRPPSGDREDPLYDWLRKLNPLAEREVVTIEPGIYFFKELQIQFRNRQHSTNFNWRLIDQLDGGMRLESNVLVLANGFRDMTAEVLDRKTNV